MRQHYHVSQFRNGCLNDADDGPYTNRRDAQAAALSVARQYRNSGNLVRGSQRDGYTMNGCYRVVVESCIDRYCLLLKGVD